ncbi:hypothetical protein L1887_11147 [Cichorium endivia]|nr:hypothetical protein L1887_11147 [Cichorium endivia]
MEEWKRSRSQLEDNPDLIHHIQSMLPEKDAARTSVLSKSWLHAWSTIPFLSFRPTAAIYYDNEQDRKHMEEVVDRTMTRYLRDNIPIESIDLNIDLDNQESASLAKKWIRSAAIKSRLKRLSLGIFFGRTSSLITWPAEILSGQTLTDIKIVCFTSTLINPFSRTTTHPVINCVSLRRLGLHYVHISEEVLNGIFSICKLLVNVWLCGCTGFRTIKVQNLHRLDQFRIDSSEENGVDLEFYDVPNIHLFTMEVQNLHRLPFNLDSLRSVTELWLGGMMINDAFLRIIKSRFRFLESLTLDMKLSTFESFDITCASMKRLSLQSCTHNLVAVKVYAPKLGFFSFSGTTMPSLLFPAIVVEQIQIELSLSISRPLKDSFFLKMREALKLSSKCDIKIDDIRPLDSDFDLDDLRRRIPFPAMNVQQLLFIADPVEGVSSFFDALFFICHPKHVVVSFPNSFNQFWMLMREVMEKKTTKGYWVDYLKDVEIRRHGDEKWETPNSWRSLLEYGSEDDSYSVEIKLNWHSVE